MSPSFGLLLMATPSFSLMNLRKYTRKKKVEAPVVEALVEAPLPIPTLERNDATYVVTDELSEDEMEDELEVEPFTDADGKKFLIDKQQNLYDFETHEPIN